MRERDQEQVLHQVRAWKDPGPVTWKEGWWNWILLVGGILMVVTAAIETRRLTGAVGGFMVGVALLALVIAVPLSRRLRTLYRLVRLADARGAYEQIEEPGQPST